MHKIYGKNRTERLIESNKRADNQASKSVKLKELKAPELTKYHNRFLLKSTRKKTTRAIIHKMDKNLLVNLVN